MNKIIFALMVLTSMAGFATSTDNSILCKNIKPNSSPNSIVINKIGSDSSYEIMVQFADISFANNGQMKDVREYGFLLGPKSETSILPDSPNPNQGVLSYSRVSDGLLSPKIPAYQALNVSIDNGGRITSVVAVAKTEKTVFIACEQ